MAALPVPSGSPGVRGTNGDNLQPELSKLGGQAAVETTGQGVAQAHL